MPPINLQVLGDRRREAARISRATGASLAHVGNVLAGRKDPSIKLAHSIAAAVGIKPADLLAMPDGTSPLRRRRRLAGINPADVARQAGISSTYLSALELGQKNPSKKVAAALADALGCKPGDLFPEDVAA